MAPGASCPDIVLDCTKVGVCTAEQEAAAELVERGCPTEIGRSMILGLD